MGWREVEEMPFSEFVKSFKAASMLDARQTLVSVDVASYANWEKQADRDTFRRELKNRATEYMERKVGDYKTVIGNLAKRIMKNGR